MPIRFVCIRSMCVSMKHNFRAQCGCNVPVCDIFFCGNLIGYAVTKKIPNSLYWLYNDRNSRDFHACHRCRRDIFVCVSVCKFVCLLPSVWNEKHITAIIEPFKTYEMWISLWMLGIHSTCVRLLFSDWNINCRNCICMCNYLYIFLNN